MTSVKKPQATERSDSENPGGEHGTRASVASIDEIDRRILTAMSRNARQSARSIAKQIGTSPGLVIDRIGQMEKGQVILGYPVEVDPRAAGLQLYSYIMLRVSSGVEYDEFLDAAIAIPEVEVASLNTGIFPVLLAVRTSGKDHLTDLINRLRRVPGFAEAEVLINLKQVRRPGSQFAFVWTDDLAR